MLDRNNKLYEASSIMPNIIATTSGMGESTKFLYTLFAEDPNLFGMYGESLMYALYAGTPIKTNSIEIMIRNFIANRNMVNSNTNHYINDPSPLIIWARLICETNQAIVFEPVMKKLNESLNNFMSNGKFVLDGVNYSLDEFKPLCYDLNGVNYLTLIPYICYITTFLLRCRPYSFSDSFSKATNTIFEKEMEKYYTTMFALFKRDHGVDFLSDNLSVIKKVDNGTLKNMISQILDPSKILQIRDAILHSETGLYEENLKEQNELTQEEVNNVYKETMNMIMSLIVKENPMKSIIAHVPSFSPKKLDSLNLALFTEYALSGGFATFCITDEGIFTLSSSDVKTPLTPFFDKQYLKSDIIPLAKSVKMPFTYADIYLKVVSSYIKAKFEEHTGDPLSGNDVINIKFSPEEFKNSSPKIASKLMSLYSQGIWNMYANTLSNAFSQSQLLQSTCQDISYLGDIIQRVYKNDMASVIIPAYIIAMIPSYLLIHSTENQPLETFKVYEYFFNYDIDSFLMDGLYKSIISLMYLGNTEYCKYVNTLAKDINKILINADTYIPYVKCLDDSADAYAIGGVSLYKYAPFQNSLVRACEIYKGIHGTSERFAFYENAISHITNSSVFEVVEDGIYDSVLKPALDRITKRDYILSDFSFNKHGASNVLPLDRALSTENKGVLITDLIKKYIFPKSDSSNSIAPSIVARKLVFNGKNPSVGKIDNNTFKFAAENDAYIELPVPIYDMRGTIKILQFKKPFSKRIIPITLYDSQNESNMVVWVLSNIEPMDRFQIHANITK